MHLTYVASAALFGNTALSASIFSQELCATKYGTQSVHSVPTTTYALTIPITVNRKISSTPVKTITPPPATITTSTTTTFTATFTAPVTIDAVIATSTETDTSTSTTTSTETSTVITTTRTTVATTSTIPTPAGFTPISQEQGYSPKVKGRSASGLAARAQPRQKTSVTLSRHAAKLICEPQLYPNSVICGELVEQVTTKTIIKTASTTSTTTIPAVTQTATSTASITTTTTFIPPGVASTATVSTTTTVSTGTTTTTTVTTTSTTTETITTPSPIIYAACSPNNIVDTANGGFDIDEISLPNTYSTVSASSGYDCCVACQLSNNCHGSVFFATECLLATPDSSNCSPGGYVSGLSFETSSEKDGGGFVVSNGPCGGIQDGGNFAS